MSLLWDASEGVCCAAYQLGACPHTEADAEEQAWENYLAECSDAELAELRQAEAEALARREAARFEQDDCPF